MSGILLLPLAPLLPFLMALACIFEPFRRRVGALLPLAPLPGLAAALMAPGSTLVLLPPPSRITLLLDVPGAVLLGASSLLWIAAGAYAARAMCKDVRLPRFAIWWLVTLAGSQCVFLVADMASFYLAFSMLSLSAYGLAAHLDDGPARRAGRVYLALTLVSEVMLLMGVVIVAAGSPEPNPLIRDAVARLPELPQGWLAFALLTCGLGVKMGLVPFHMWMPLAHSVAPIAGSAVLSGIVVKAGVIGLLRFLPFGVALPDWGGWLVTGGLVTAFYGVAVGLTQTHPKTVLAYSTVSQMGVVAAAIGAALGTGTEVSAAPIAFYAANHMLLKGALFLAVGVVGATGAARATPFLVLTGLLGLSLAGLPFTGGALAKYAIKEPFGDGVAGMLVTLSAAGTMLLMAHFLHLLRRARTAEEKADAPRGLMVPWLALSVGALVLPFLLFPLATPYGLLATFGFMALGVALWPVLLGLGLAYLGWRLRIRLPVVPPGDLLALAARLAPFGERAGAALVRFEAALRRWPVGGTVLAGLALVLALAAGAGR